MNNFNYPTTLPSFGGFQVGGGFGFHRPSFGGMFPGMGGGLAHGMMGGFCNPWGSMGFHRPHGHFGHHGHQGHFGSHGHHHQQHAPREGEWNAGKGSYTVGRSGQVDVNVGKADADFNNKMQYRVNGGDWQTFANSKDAGKNTTIHAPPGSQVEFRINTPQGNNFQAGTTNNRDGIDHAKVSTTGSGFQLGFEDLAGPGGDFGDAVLNLSDPGRRRW